MPIDQHVNGVDVTRMADIIGTVRREPEAAKFVFRAHTKWVTGAHAYSTIRSFQSGGKDDSTRAFPFILHADEPAPMLGTNYGPNPAETVLHALASCVGTAMVYHAAARGIEIDSVEIEVVGNVDARGLLGVSEDVRRGFQNIRLNCKINADVPDDKLEELIELGKNYSPVFDIVTNPVPVEVTVQGKKAARTAM